MNPGKQFSQYRRVLHKGLSADVEHTRNIQEQVRICYLHFEELHSNTPDLV